MSAAASDADDSFVVLVEHAEVEPYEVRIAKRLCHEGRAGLEAIMARVREKHPCGARLTAPLKPFNFESAPWTDRNICSLPKHKYILLADTGATEKVKRFKFFVI